MSRRLPDFQAESRESHARLGLAGAARLLDEAREWAREWDLAGALKAGGAVVFPHIGLDRCGLHTAATVAACFDAAAGSAITVVAIGVLHALTDELEAARVRVATGADPSQETTRSVQGPGLPGREDWRNEFSLLDFLFLWDAQSQRTPAQIDLIVRYPYLAGGHPEQLPGISDLERIVRGEKGRRSILVATADPFHHGIGYGDPVDQALTPEAGGLDLARRRIAEGLELLARGDHWGYNRHCVAAKSDARDVGQVLRYLIGPLRGSILDLTWADTAAAYGGSSPTWVAGALMSWIPLPESAVGWQRPFACARKSLPRRGE